MFWRCGGDVCVPFLAVPIHQAGLAARVRIPVGGRWLSRHVHVSPRKNENYGVTIGRCGRS